MARNKKHKQRHSSKTAIKDKAAGRVVGDGSSSNPVTAKARKTIGFGLPKDTGVKMQKGGNPAGDKERRKMAAKALRMNKNANVRDDQMIGTLQGPPRIMAIIPGNESANVEALYQSLQRFHGEEEVGSPGVPCTMVDTKTRRHLTILCETDGNEQNIIDAAKVADIVCITLDVSSQVQDAIEDAEREQIAMTEDGSVATWFSRIGLCITDQTRDIISALKSQGCPTVLVALQGADTYDNPKKTHRVMKLHTRYFESVLPPEHKVMSVTEDNEMESFMRAAHSSKLRKLPWREIRPYFIAEEADYDEDTNSMRVGGYLRGGSMNANQLMHITNYGTYQIEKLLVGEDIVDESTPETREPLDQVQRSETVEEDHLATEEDVRYAEAQAAREAATMRQVMVPAGVSEYQAAWYENEEGAAITDAVHDQKVQDDIRQQIIVAKNPDYMQNEDGRSTQFTAQTEVDFLKPADILRHEKMTDEERLKELQELKEASGEELDSPDVVPYVPFDMPTHQRFAKYRGMKSFAHGQWNPNENLPIHFGYIFKMHGYQNVRKLAIDHDDTTVHPDGTYVTVQIANVGAKTWESISQILICSIQLQHEQKFSMLHYQVQRSSEFDEPIKSKTPMLAHLGFRKFYIAPIFSELGVGDRAKFSRFFHEGDNFRVASFFGPITYHPTPILLFKTVSQEEQEEGTPLRLAAYGSGMPPNPDRMIIKRAVLDGRVHMIHKKQITVKFMFFNDEDVRYFQPVDIYTKFGRRGKITKAIGGHGLFKAQLNDQIMQHDVIMMDLYKRVFPKWTTVPFTMINDDEDDDDEEAEVVEEED